jgi:cyclophilin family peptidyl-prolyl cis-trans isomerase
MHLWRPFGIVILLAGMLTACGASASATASGAANSADACPSASATPERTFTSPPPMQIDPKKQYTATIQTQYGNIVIQLLPQQAPTTVNNFVFLACHKFYDGLTFHRIVPGFVIQGGDPQGNGAGGPGYQFKDELPSSSSVYTAGAVAMANSGPNTNGSQFFICVADDTKQLQPQYSYFGKVTQGMDVVQNLTKVQLTTGPDMQQSKPITPVVMQHVTIQVQ